MKTETIEVQLGETGSVFQGDLFISFADWVTGKAVYLKAGAYGKPTQGRAMGVGDVWYRAGGSDKAYEIRLLKISSADEKVTVSVVPAVRLR